MAKFAYNNTKNTNTSYISFKLNYDNFFRVLLKENINFYSKSYFINKLTKKLREIIEICCQNLLYIQKLQKNL